MCENSIPVQTASKDHNIPSATCEMIACPLLLTTIVFPPHASAPNNSAFVIHLFFWVVNCVPLVPLPGKLNQSRAVRLDFKTTTTTTQHFDAFSSNYLSFLGDFLCVSRWFKNIITRRRRRPHASAHANDQFSYFACVTVF